MINFLSEKKSILYPSDFSEGSRANGVAVVCLLTAIFEYTCQGCFVPRLWPSTRHPPSSLTSALVRATLSF